MRVREVIPGVFVGGISGQTRIEARVTPDGWRVIQEDVRRRHVIADGLGRTLEHAEADAQHTFALYQRAQLAEQRRRAAQRSAA